MPVALRGDRELHNLHINYPSSKYITEVTRKFLTPLHISHEDMRSLNSQEEFKYLYEQNVDKLEIVVYFFVKMTVGLK